MVVNEEQIVRCHSNKICITATVKSCLLQGTDAYACHVKAEMEISNQIAVQPTLKRELAGIVSQDSDHAWAEPLNIFEMRQLTSHVDQPLRRPV